jgi:hypothetical protein
VSVTVEGRLIVAEALTRLAIARSVALDETTAEVYLTGLADIEPSLVVRACHELAITRVKDFDPAWPRLADIRYLAVTMGERDHEPREDWRDECEREHGGRCQSQYVHGQFRGETLSADVGDAPVVASPPVPTNDSEKES